MPRIVLVTDSSAGIPGAVAAEAGIVVVQGTFALGDTTLLDGELAAAELYQRMAADGAAPRPFGVSEPAFRAAFEAVFAACDEPFCLLTPFDVNPSFTIANAAMLSLDDVDMKVVNPGVASSGLCSLLLTLSEGLVRGWDRRELLDAIDSLAPRCDSVFVPASAAWLERSGRLALIRDRLGDVDGGHLVVRVGTRITGVALAETRDEALARAVAAVGQRAGDGPVVVTIAHAAAPDAAWALEQFARAELPVAQLVVTELSATFGSQLGPGAVGIGVAPALAEVGDA